MPENEFWDSPEVLGFVKSGHLRCVDTEAKPVPALQGSTASQQPCGRREWEHPNVIRFSTSIQGEFGSHLPAKPRLYGERACLRLRCFLEMGLDFGRPGQVDPNEKLSPQRGRAPQRRGGGEAPAEALSPGLWWVLSRERHSFSRVMLFLAL